LQFIFIFLSYLIGSVPFGLLLGRVAGIDVRQGGSGNIGATNVSRLVGKKIGAFTLLLDAGKGFFPMLGAGIFGADQNTVLLCGIAAFVGHLYPIYLKFRGGKGVATALGVFLYLDPVAVLICIVAFIAVVALSGYVSAGSLTAAALMPVLILIFRGPQNIALCALVVALLIWLKHYSNISRLIRGEEKSWKKRSAKE
jgi:glycerol-3-phosphate acyltransferase PlsY